MKLHKQLSLAFMGNTGCSFEKSSILAQKYIDACIRQVLLHLSKVTENDNVYIAQDELRRSLKDVVVNGTRYYVWNEFQKTRYRIFTSVTIGSNLTEKITMAQLNYDLEELLIAAGDSKELVKELYKQSLDDIVEYIPIDRNSLESYILGNRDIDRSNTADAQKITRVNTYLYHALRIKLIAQEHNNTMPHVINESVFGRKYYKGPNLQNTPKIVRLAALGNCHEYDIESSVFAWKMSLFQQICRENDTEIARPATLQYLDYKAAMRRQVAQAVFGSQEDGYVNIIKQAITALGFGAPARSSGYTSNGKYEPTALSTIIKSRAKLQAFLNDAWVKTFVEEQRTMTEVIIQKLKETGEYDHLRTIPDMIDRAGRIRTNSMISYLYQQSERQILEYMIEQAEPGEILLTVHDCIYTKNPINLRELREGLIKFGNFYRVSHEQHRAYAYDPHSSAHKQQIRLEEQAARGFKNEFTDNNQTSTPLKFGLEERKMPANIPDFYDGFAADCNYNRDEDPYYDEL